MGDEHGENSIDLGEDALILPSPSNPMAVARELLGEWTTEDLSDLAALARRLDALGTHTLGRGRRPRDPFLRSINGSSTRSIGTEARRRNGFEMGADPSQDRQPAGGNGCRRAPTVAPSTPRHGPTATRTSAARSSLWQTGYCMCRPASCLSTLRDSSISSASRSTMTPWCRRLTRWLHFLDDLWGDDVDSINALAPSSSATRCPGRPHNTRSC